MIRSSQNETFSQIKTDAELKRSAELEILAKLKIKYDWPELKLLAEFK